MKYIIHTKAFNDDYNVVEYIEKINDDSYVDFYFDCFTDIDSFLYLIDKKNVIIPINKKNVIIEDFIEEEFVGILNTDKILDKTTYICVVNIVDNKKYIKNIKLKRFSENIDSRVNINISEGVFEYLNKNQKKMDENKIYINLDITNITDIGKIIEVKNSEYIYNRQDIKNEADIQLKSRLTPLYMFELTEYLNAFMYLNTNGYNLKEDNKKELYINLQESGNKEALDAYKSYLNIKIKTESVLEMYDKYKAFITDLNNDDNGSTDYRESYELYNSMLS